MFVYLNNVLVSHVHTEARTLNRLLKTFTDANYKLLTYDETALVARQTCFMVMAFGVRGELTMEM